MKRVWVALPAGACSAAQGAGIDLETHCLDCHRPGQTRGEVPLIEGQQHDYLRNQLSRFHDRHRLSFPMSTLAGGLDDAAIDSAARDLSKRTWPRDTVAVAPKAIQRGRERARRLACESCHGEHYLGAGDIPRVAGQQPGYLARQIGAFGVGHRYHPPTGTGSPMYSVSTDEARDLAAFLHSLPREDRKPAD